MSENKVVAMIQRSRPAKPTQAYLKEMLGFRDHAVQVLDSGVQQRLPQGGVKSRAEGYGVTETPLTTEDRQSWQEVRDAAQAEVDWATASMPAHKRSKAR